MAISVKSALAAVAQKTPQADTRSKWLVTGCLGLVLSTFGFVLATSHLISSRQTITTSSAVVFSTATCGAWGKLCTALSLTLMSITFVARIRTTTSLPLGSKAAESSSLPLV